MSLRQLFNHFDFTPDVLEVGTPDLPPKEWPVCRTWMDITDFIFDHGSKAVVSWSVGRGDFGEIWLFVEVV